MNSSKAHSADLQLIININPNQAGILIAVALQLGAEMPAIGLLENLPYHKNAKVLPEEPKRLGRPKGSKGKSTQTSDYLANKDRRKKARESVITALKAAGAKGMDEHNARAIFAENGGIAYGFGISMKSIATREDGKIFLEVK